MAIVTSPKYRSAYLKLITGEDANGVVQTVSLNIGPIDATKVAEYSDQKVLNIRNALAPVLAYQIAEVRKMDTSIIEEEE